MPLHPRPSSRQLVPSLRLLLLPRLSLFVPPNLRHYFLPSQAQVPNLAHAPVLHDRVERSGCVVRRHPHSCGWTRKVGHLVYGNTHGVLPHRAYGHGSSGRESKSIERVGSNSSLGDWLPPPNQAAKTLKTIVNTKKNLTTDKIIKRLNSSNYGVVTSKKSICTELYHVVRPEIGDNKSVSTLSTKLSAESLIRSWSYQSINTLLCTLYLVPFLIMWMVHDRCQVWI